MSPDRPGWSCRPETRQSACSWPRRRTPSPRRSTYRRRCMPPLRLRACISGCTRPTRTGSSALAAVQGPLPSARPRLSLSFMSQAPASHTAMGTSFPSTVPSNNGVAVGVLGRESVCRLGARPGTWPSACSQNSGAPCTGCSAVHPSTVPLIERAWSPVAPPHCRRGKRRGARPGREQLSVGTVKITAMFQPGAGRYVGDDPSVRRPDAGDRPAPAIR